MSYACLMFYIWVFTLFTIFYSFVLFIFRNVGWMCFVSKKCSSRIYSLICLRRSSFSISRSSLAYFRRNSMDSTSRKLGKISRVVLSWIFHNAFIIQIKLFLSLDSWLLWFCYIIFKYCYRRSFLNWSIKNLKSLFWFFMIASCFSLSNIIFWSFSFSIVSIVKCVSYFF